MNTRKPQYSSASSDEETDFRRHKVNRNGDDDSDSELDNNAGFNSDEEGLTGVIDLINKLQSVVSILEKSDGYKSIDLPRIIVCGSQSSGKTSVLESICREEFLPRGTDIQTRYPIVIQLLHQKDGRKWVEFDHIPGKKYERMAEVRQVLERKNMEVAKRNTVISDKEVTITLHSPDVPDLTVVDLPGLVENATKDQPPDLVEKIEDLVVSFIENKNSIILAVTEATSDVAASKSIRVANRVDPNRERTVAVITKLDLMDEGTTVKDVLTGKKIEFKLGILGVINRSFRDTENRVSFADVRKKEEIYLRRVYGQQLAKVNGTAFLTWRISELLKTSIYKNLPRIRQQLDPQIEKIQARLDELGEPPHDAADKKGTLRRTVTDFCLRYIAQVDGRKRNLNVDTLHAHVRINMVYGTVLKKTLDELPQQDLSNETIVTAILNASALHSTTIDPDDAFQELAKREIQKMRPVLLKINSNVKAELVKAVETSWDPETRQMYPRLYDTVRNLAKKLIHTHSKQSEAYLNDYMSAECSITRSKTIDLFKGQVKEMAQELEFEDEFDTDHSDEEEEGKGEDDESEEDEGVVALKAKSKELAPGVRRDVNNCIKKVKIGILEHVPKGITHKLVYGVSDKIMDYMIGEVYKPENQDMIDRLMHVADGKVDERKEKQARLVLLEEAISYIDGIITK